MGVLQEIDSIYTVKYNSSEVIAVDFDGTLATYETFNGATSLGQPIPKMVERVKNWLKEGKEVVIFTARITDNTEAVHAISDWSLKHIGTRLQITNVKHWRFKEMWDDRAIQIITNTGIRADGEE